MLQPAELHGLLVQRGEADRIDLARHAPRPCNDPAPSAPKRRRRHRSGSARPDRAARCRWAGRPGARCRRDCALLRSCSTRSVGTSTPAMCWPSAHSQGSPTSTTLAAARVSGRASRRATSSGPMPAGSPSVSATTGLSLILSCHVHSTLMPRRLMSSRVALVLRIVEARELRPASSA